MIRPAVPTDVQRLMEMGHAFFIEAGWDKHADFDEESFAFTCGALIANGILLVADKDDNGVVGMAAAGIAPAYWNRSVLTAQELFWYCEPAHRLGLGSKLMKELEAAAIERGVVLFSMSAEEGLRSEALSRLYRQRGYFPMEKLFWKSFGREAA
ncbi:MAG TPA: GNAT family N-acetyltransferase [Thiobacillus sp.]